MNHTIKNSFLKFQLKVNKQLYIHLKKNFVFLHEQVYQVQQMLLQRIVPIIQMLFDVIKNVD